MHIAVSQLTVTTLGACLITLKVVEEEEEDMGSSFTDLITV